MRLHLLLFLCFTLVFASCSKKEEVILSDVWIRIDNQSGISMQDAKIGAENYGEVAPGVVTAYQRMTLPIYSGNCSFKANNSDAYAGYLICGTPMPPAFEPGYYTFRIEPPNQGWFPLEVIR